MLDEEYRKSIFRRRCDEFHYLVKTKAEAIFLWEAFDMLKRASEALEKAQIAAGTILEPEEDDDLQSFLKAQTIYINLVCDDYINLVCDDEEDVHYRKECPVNPMSNKSIGGGGDSGTVSTTNVSTSEDEAFSTKDELEMKGSAEGTMKFLFPMEETLEKDPLA